MGLPCDEQAGGENKIARIYHDVTLELSPSILVIPEVGSPEFREVKRISSGDLFNATVMTLNTHTGTHIDAPKHFYDDGLTIERLDLDCLLGPARVIEIRDRASIAKAELQKHKIGRNEIILLKTDNSRLITMGSFHPDFTFLTLEAAQYLADIGIRTLGFDYFSVERLDGSPVVHYLLLGSKIVIIEGLNLSEVDPGEYQMVALPLKIKNGNGSPTRVVLIREE
jgi:arylformamidase